jgi:hypothetical protein
MMVIRKKNEYNVKCRSDLSLNYARQGVKLAGRDWTLQARLSPISKRPASLDRVAVLNSYHGLPCGHLCMLQYRYKW